MKRQATSGSFEKGYVPWNKGISTKLLKVNCVCGKEFEEYASDIKAGGGKYCTRACYNKYHKVWNKGNSIAMSKENSPRWKGGLPNCLDCGKELSQRHSKTGYCRQCFGKTEEGKAIGRNNLGEPRRGKDNWNWKGGVTGKDRMERVKFRKTMQKLVFERDNYTCQICESTQDLQVDHIQRWSEYVDLRFSMDNCRTLCAKCHYQITFNKPMPESTKGWGHNFIERMVS